MNAALRREVKERSEERCEYCHLPQSSSVMSFHIEHIIPRRHGGETELSNLALACPHCNLHKGPNLTGMDPDRGEVLRLFHPRQDVWDQNFSVDGGYVTGLTAIGRTTVWLLRMNEDDQVGLRRE